VHFALSFECGSSPIVSKLAIKRRRPIGRTYVIPGSFAYHRPSSIEDAIKILTDYGDEARPLAGGHSLIPMMKLRMAAPAHLVDLRGLPELASISEAGDIILVGAMVTQAQLQASDVLTLKLPILREASTLIADPQVRSMGTLGGNVANGDPGNDMPAIMMALDASYVLTGGGGERQIKARQFYNGAYDTALQPGEILTAIRISSPPAHHGYAYEKLKRKVGDYAIAAAAVILTVQDGKIATCAVALTNVADRTLFAEEASSLIVGTSGDDAVIRHAAAAATAITEPSGDGRGPVEYRRAMAGVMVARALKSAISRAKGV
jgi:aerobic carbon-monoxide dehydrogenase medium subunit